MAAVSGFDHHDPEIEAMMEARALAQARLPEARARRVVFGGDRGPFIFTSAQLQFDVEPLQRALNQAASIAIEAATRMALFGKVTIEIDRSCPSRSRVL